MAETDESTRPESPNAKRLSFPPLQPLPEDATDHQVKVAWANAIMVIASNLQYLRDAEEARGEKESANERVIRDHGGRITDLEQRVRALEGGRLR